MNSLPPTGDRLDDDYDVTANQPLGTTGHWAGRGRGRAVSRGRDLVRVDGQETGRGGEGSESERGH